MHTLLTRLSWNLGRSSKILLDLTHILSYANLTKILDKSCEIVIRCSQDLVWILYNMLQANTLASPVVTKILNLGSSSKYKILRRKL